MNKQALITGGARRIGRVIAQTLASAGWDLLIHYNKAANEAEHLAETLREKGRKIRLVQADLEKDEGLEILFHKLDEDDTLTAIVHNASLFELNEKDPSSARHFAVNDKAPRALTQKLFEMIPGGQLGSAVFMFDHTPLPPTLSHYAASKQSLRDDFAELTMRNLSKLRLNAVALGPTLRAERESEAHFHCLVAQTLLQKPSTPEDVAKAVLLLLEAQSIVGHVIPVDSGLHLRGF